MPVSLCTCGLLARTPTAAPALVSGTHSHAPQHWLRTTPRWTSRGWQRHASHAVDDFCHRAIRPDLEALTWRCWTHKPGRMPPASSLLVRLRRAITWRFTLPRAAPSPTPHALPPVRRPSCQGRPLERAAARICREAGATGAMNVRLRDLNVDAARQDERRIEVIANGLALWGGAQVAVDTMLVLVDFGGRAPAAARPGLRPSLPTKPKSEPTQSSTRLSGTSQSMLFRLHPGESLSLKTAISPPSVPDE